MSAFVNVELPTVKLMLYAARLVRKYVPSLKLPPKLKVPVPTIAGGPQQILLSKVTSYELA